MLKDRDVLLNIESASIAEVFAAEFVEHAFPPVEILTRRLLLRAYTSGDVDGHRAIFDHDRARNWSIAPQPYTDERASDWCSREAERIRRSGEGICWAGESRETGRLVGMTGFHRTDWERRTTDVSATAAASVIGQGYATEALRAMSHWLLTHRRFNRIQITADARNTAPQHVAAACGFTREGILRNGGCFRGKSIDMVLYSLVPSDLDGLPTPNYQVRYPGSPFPAQREMELT